MKAKIILCTIALYLNVTYAQNLIDSNKISNNNENIFENLNVEEFNKKVNNKNKLVLVNFSADWCIVCKKQKPILDQIKVEKKNIIEIIYLNMEKNPLIADYFEVDGLPVNLLYDKGKIIWSREGIVSKIEMLELLNNNK
jgi:thioredoxin 1